MNLNATPETVRAVTQTLKLAGILDDRVAMSDKARIAAWSEQVQRHKLAEVDLLDGLQSFYDSPSERAIQIGDLIHHARNAKRTRIDREEDAECERRRAELDAKAADDMATLTADAIGGRIKNRTERLKAAEAALLTCQGRDACKAAVVEYLAAKREASGKRRAVA